MNYGKIEKISFCLEWIIIFIRVKNKICAIIYTFHKTVQFYLVHFKLTKIHLSQISFPILVRQTRSSSTRNLFHLISLPKERQ